MTKKDQDKMPKAVSCEPQLGIPGNPLPVWKQLPFNAKLPVPTKIPKGKAVYCTAKLGSPVPRMLRLSHVEGI